MQELWSALALDRVGFTLAFLGYIFFFALLVSVKARNLQRTLLLGFTVATAGWALLYALTLQIPFQTGWSVWLENGRYLLLILFLYAALQGTLTSLNLFLKQSVVLITIATLLVWTAFTQLGLLSVNLFLSGQLLICIFVLALLEALYRRSGQARWQFKPLIIALGVAVIFDFVLLAEGSLFQRLDLQLWYARSYIQLSMLPLLVIAVRRIKAWNIRVYISRDIVLQSSLIFSAGIYLCLMAVAGFYMRYTGGDWSTLLQAIFVVLGFALLAGLVLSDGMRRKAKVFIEKHFFENSFDYREKWLELTHRLRDIDVKRNQIHKDALSAWLHAIGYNRGALVRIKNQQKVLALINRPDITQQEIRLLERYRNGTWPDNWIIDLKQINGLSVYQSNANDGLVYTQLIIPIRDADGLWGFCLLDTDPKLQLKLNWELKDYLVAVTEQIISYLFLVEANNQLMENAQFAAFNRMSAFVVHDMKNISAQLGLLLKNAQKHKNNPDFIDDAFTTIAASKARMDKMLAQLTNKNRSEDSITQFDVSELVTHIISTQCRERLPQPKLRSTVSARLTLDKERFSNVLFHLIDNAQYATAEDGQIWIDLSQTEEQLEIRIADTGCGMSKDFIAERLFKPFDTTKGNAGMGIGVFDAKSFIEQVGGVLQVFSEPGVGTTFVMQLPLNLIKDSQ